MFLRHHPIGRLTCTACASGEDAYAQGPTACVAHPKVVAQLRKLVRSANVLSAADARLARHMGLLDIPEVGRTGMNDGVIYPPGDAPAATRMPRRRAPSAKLAAPKTTGTMHCLVLLVDFSDRPGTTPAAHYEQLLFDKTNPNSMNRFYRDLSYGQLDVTGEVVGWLRAPQPYSYYVNNESGTGNTYPRNTPGLLHDMLEIYCRTHGLKPFDLNADGYVDGLFLVHAGPGAETQTSAAQRRAMIWSHKWTLPQPFTNAGVKAYAYFTAPEDGRLGVFSHEFGHFIGLPDLYDTTYRSAGIGNWCLMAGGSWNGNGDMPARLSAWCLASLGWIKPRTVKAAASHALDTLENKKTQCLRLWSKGQAGPEYFLLENRQQAGRDADLPGHGLALWHIDERQSENTNALAYRVGLVQADGRRDLELNHNEGDPADLFPGANRVTKVSDAAGTAPHTRANDGNATGVALSAISERAGIVKVRVKV